MKRKCENCDYWHRYSGGGSGECRRHAPAPMYSMTGDKPGPIWWPQTLNSFWCGDFTERSRAEVDASHLEVTDANYGAAWTNMVMLEASRREAEKSPKKNMKKITKKIQKENRE